MIVLPAREHVPETQIFVDVCRGQSIEKGSSDPLFILPGGPGANSTHFTSYRCLQESIELVFHDPRGCGASDKGDPDHYSLDNYIDDVEAIRKSLGMTKIALLGKSYSGLCALGYTIRYPKAVSKLILVATGPSHHFISTAKKKLAQIGSPAQIRACEKLWEGRFSSTDEVDHYFDLMKPLYSTKAISTMTLNQPAKELPFAHEPLNRGFLTDLRTVDYMNELSSITCQTLVITGDSDWIFDEKYSRLMADKIPNAKLVILKNAGHFLEMDAPDEFYSVVRNFMR